jgi:hypothetical protein
MSAINAFLLKNNLRIATNPCVSPDFCLDWPALADETETGAAGVKVYEKSRFATKAGEFLLLEDSATGDCAWKLAASNAAALAERRNPGGRLDGVSCDLRQSPSPEEPRAGEEPASTIFPTAREQARPQHARDRRAFHHAALAGDGVGDERPQLGMTANQNSIPRELVYDVDVMLAGKLDTVPFPFIGTNVPEGHQGQSVEGMSHGCVLSKLKTGFHHRGIAWSFNADHQPIGGKFDNREDALVTGCVLASYITFDLSPELAQTKVADDAGAWVKANVPGRARHDGEGPRCQRLASRSTRPTLPSCSPTSGRRCRR